MSTETLSVPSTANATRERDKPRGTTAASAPPYGMLWFAGWLFTIAFAKLVWWKALLALLLWPYFLGEVLR